MINSPEYQHTLKQNAKKERDLDRLENIKK